MTTQRRRPAAAKRATHPLHVGLVGVESFVKGHCGGRMWGRFADRPTGTWARLARTPVLPAMNQAAPWLVTKSHFMHVCTTRSSL
eukprot:531019-Pleurochrysis_carterae.AAC.1